MKIELVNNNPEILELNLEGRLDTITSPEFEAVVEKELPGKFKMELENGSMVKVYGYDEIADFIYKKLQKNNSVLIEGSLDSNRDIECKIIYWIF